MEAKYSDKQQKSMEKLTWQKVMATSKHPRKRTAALLEMAEISLQLDNYDDLFSDFDPRPYRERSLSTDFLEEASRASRDKQDAIELHLMIPKRLRRPDHEAMIRKRLKEHFKNHFHRISKEAATKRNGGIAMAVGGATLLTFATFMSHTLPDSFTMSLLHTIIEPAGWFTSWSGLERVFFKTKDENVELDFYRKMTNCRVVFQGY